MKNNKQQNGMAFIGLVLAMAIAAVLYFFVAKKYLASSAGQNKEIQQALAGQGINVSSIHDAIRNAQEAAEKANKLNKNLEDATPNYPE